MVETQPSRRLWVRSGHGATIANRSFMTQSDTLRTRITALRQVYAPWTLGVQRQLQMLAGQHGRTIPLEDMRIRQKISLQFRGE